MARPAALAAAHSRRLILPIILLAIALNIKRVKPQACIFREAAFHLRRRQAAVRTLSRAPYRNRVARHMRENGMVGGGRGRRGRRAAAASNVICHCPQATVAPSACVTRRAGVMP